MKFMIKISCHCFLTVSYMSRAWPNFTYVWLFLAQYIICEFFVGLCLPTFSSLICSPNMQYNSKTCSRISARIYGWPIRLSPNLQAEQWVSLSEFMVPTMQYAELFVFIVFMRLRYVHRKFEDDIERIAARNWRELHFLQYRSLQYTLELW